jgi:hypothetical protein
MGFVQGLSTQTASGVITSYSTTTSYSTNIYTLHSINWGRSTSRTDTYVKIYTSAATYTYTYTIDESVHFLGSMGSFLLFAVTGIMVLIGVALASRFGGKMPAPAKREEMPIEPSAKLGEERRAHEQKSGETAIFLARLEELKKRGEIGEDTYEKLRREYWERIEKPAKRTTKACVICGSLLPLGAAYCPECGQRQTEGKIAGTRRS